MKDQIQIQILEFKDKSYHTKNIYNAAASAFMNDKLWGKINPSISKVFHRLALKLIPKL